MFKLSYNKILLPLYLLAILNATLVLVFRDLPVFFSQYSQNFSQNYRLALIYSIYRVLSLAIFFVLFVVLFWKSVNFVRSYVLSPALKIYYVIRSLFLPLATLPVMKNRQEDAGISIRPEVYAIILFTIPVIFDLIIFGWSRIFSYFAGDSFYYMTISRNFIERHMFTFDGMFPTNGFHPLWQWFETIMFVIGSYCRICESNQILIIFLLNLLLISISILFLARGFREANGFVPVEFIVFPMGFYALLTFWIHPQFGSLYSFINGMETPFLILSYSVVFYLSSKNSFIKTNSNAVIFGLFLGIISLSRLDHALFAVTFLVLLFLNTMPGDTRISKKRIMISGIVWAGLLGIYLAYNYASIGVLVPVSGSEKSTFPYPSLANWNLVIERTFYFHKFWQEVLYRFTQVLLPVLTAAVFIFWYAFKLPKKHRNRLDWILFVTAVFVLGYASYNFFYVPLWGQGHWYFPISIIFSTLAIIQIICRNFDLKPLYSKICKTAVIVSVALFFTFVFKDSDYNNVYSSFYNEEVKCIHDFYSGFQPKIIELDDGIIGFSTGYPTMSGFGFTLDPQACKCKKENLLIPLAYSRGFDRIASYYYFANDKSWKENVSDNDLAKAFKQSMSWIIPHDIEIELEYRSPKNNFAIFKIKDPMPGKDVKEILQACAEDDSPPVEISSPL